MNIQLYTTRFFTLLALLTAFSSRLLAQGPPPPPAYCTTGLYINACSTSNDFINNFSTQGASIDISNLNTGCNGQTDNYIYYAGNQMTCSPGQLISLNMQSGTSWAQGFAVWIDWNVNGTFGDTPDELVYSSPNAALTPFSGSFTVPATASNGLTRMRVRCQYNAVPTDPCASLNFGEIEDYDVFVGQPIPCPVPPVAGVAAASVSSICPNTAFSLSLSGFSIGVGTAFQWQSSPDGVNFTDIGGATSSFLNGQTITDTTYYRCVVFCNTNSTISNAVMVGINDFFACYCNTGLGGGCNSAGITEFSIASTTLHNFGTLCDNLNGPNYSVYPAADSTTANLNETASYNFTVNTNGNAIISVWIDFDHSGTYDASEWTQVATTTTANLPTTISIPIPLGSLPGLTGMRVRSRLSGNVNGATSACLNFGSGSTQDYVINIIPAVPCSGVPNAGTAVSSDTLVCGGGNVNLSVQNSTAASGLTYQWQSSSDGVNFTDIVGANTITWAETVNSTSYYRVVVSCGSNTANSSSIMVSTVNCVIMPLNSSTTVTTCQTLFYDSGGPNGNYQNVENDTITFLPGTPGGFVQMNFTQFNVENNFEFLTFYNGSDVTAPILGPAAGYTGTNSPGLIAASNANGSLTVVFRSDGSVVLGGWAATVSCLTGPPSCATNQLPLDASTGVCLNSGVLQWANTPAASGYHVSFGTSPTLSGVTPVNVNINTFDPGLLLPNTTYYYQVIPYNAFGDATGCTIQSFTTGDCIQIIMSNDSINACAAQFYSSGGPAGGYQNNENYTYVIHPSTPGNAVQVSFNNFNVSNDQLLVYDGSDVTAPLIGTYTGAVFPPVITAGLLNPGNGTLTFQFISNAFTTAVGWDATVSCIDPNSLPSCSTPLLPADASTGVSVFTPITWTLGTGGGIPTGYNIFFGTQGNLTQVATNITGTSWTPPSLNTNTTYCYQIVPVNVAGSPTGCPTTCFTTDTTLAINIFNGSVSTCSGILYDSGGPNGNYQNNEYYTLTINPSTAGNIVQLNFTDFNVEDSFEFLKIFDGPNNTSPLIGSFTGTVSPGTVTAGLLNPGNGVLTVEFTSDGSVTLSGFAAAISCISPNTPPTCATNLSPADASTNVQAIGTNLTWNYGTGGGIPTGYDVYFGLQGNLTQVQTGYTTTSYALPNLNLNTSYCYQIVAVNASGSATGCPVSCFTTDTVYIIPITNGSDSLCAGLFTDSGGPNGNYQNSENFTYTLYPGTVGNVVQLNFSSFQIENNYDFMRIYDGTDITAPLIGTFTNANSPGLVTAGVLNPGNTALTIVFTSDVVVNQAGWTASINCINPNATPTCVNYLAPANAATAVNVYSALAWAPGSGGGIPSSYDVYMSTAGGPFVLVSDNQTTTTYTPSQPFALSTQYCYYVVASNAGGTAPVCDTICFTTASQAEILMTNGSVSTCNGIFYDSGGSTGNYQNGENYTFTIYPGTPGNLVQAVFNSFNVENNFEDLLIYSGTTANAANLIGTYTGTTTPGTVVSADSTTGALTFVFTSDLSVSLAGWDATISCIPTSNCVTPLISYTGPSTVCAGTTVTLTSSISTNTWSNGETSQTINVVVNSDTTITVANSSAGCSSSVSQPVNLYASMVPTPTLSSASGSTVICNGQPVVVNVTIPGMPAPPSNYTYSWSNGATTPSISASTAGCYSVTVTNQYNCSASSAQLCVTSVPTPVISAGSTTSFCSGGSVTLSTTASSGIQWYNGSTAVGSGQNTYTATQAGNYSVAITSGTCVATSNVINVAVNSIVVPTITASATEICSGGTATLTCSSNPDYISYLWSNNLGTAPVASTQAAGTYTVTVVSSNGCSATSASVTINVGTVGTQPQVTIGGSNILCEGQNVTLLSSSIAGNQWNLNGTPIPGGSGVTMDANQTGLYSVTVTTGACVTTSANVPIIVNPLPTAAGGFSSSSNNGVVVFSNNSQNAVAYQWNFGDQTAYSNDNNPVHTYTTDGTFTVILTAYNNCGSNTDTLQVSVFGTGVRSLTHGEKLAMYPNPAQDRVTIDFTDNSSKSLRVNLVSITGELVYTETLSNFNSKYKRSIDLSNLAPGVYFVNIHTDNDTITRKVVKN